jgi:cobalt/nickel transport system permease protein
MSHLMKVIVYLFAVIAITWVHNPLLLIGGLLLAMSLAWTNAVKVLLRALRMVLWVSLTLSLGYIVMGIVIKQFDGSYLLLLNSRIILLSFLTSWLMQTVCWRQAMARWPNAQRWLIVVRTQSDLFKQLSAQYRDAIRSRSGRLRSLRMRYFSGAAMGLALLDKSVHNSEALSMGMRSRGVFDD